jgi:hypothetical protein
MAMSLGGEYQIPMITYRHWARVAGELHVSADGIFDRIRAMTLELPDLAASVRTQMEAEGLGHPTVTRLTQLLASRATVCLRALNPPAGVGQQQQRRRHHHHHHRGGNA